MLWKSIKSNTEFLSYNMLIEAYIRGFGYYNVCEQEHVVKKCLQT